MIFIHADRYLTPYLHGELTPKDRERVERHLAACLRCRSHAALLRAVDAVLPTLLRRAAPDALWQRIEQDLDARQDNIQAQKKALLHRTFRWVAATLLLLIAGGFGRWAMLRQRAPSWEVRTLQGSPAIGWFAFGDYGKLRVGDTLTTDRASRAEIEVADIGTVKIAPGSKVTMTATSAKQHRLALEQGALEAKVVAPPRLFIVDTQAARAVDLGCAYRLETDGSGTTLLRVTLGEVALEGGGRSSLVPMGFSCESRRGVGLGTPVKDDAAILFRQAVRRLDFEGGGDLAAELARHFARPQDGITLWHLLRRTSEPERGKLFDTLSRFSPPRQSATRAGVMRGDPVMLDTWKEIILNDLAESEMN